MIDRYTFTPCETSGEIRRIFGIPDIDAAEYGWRDLRKLAANYCANRFDLLGSGWMKVGYGCACPGIAGIRYAAGKEVNADNNGDWLATRINPQNLEKARQIWMQIRQPYEPVNWHLYYKSGYRIAESTHYSEITIWGPRGTDIKEPWELARMQHLPQLALAYHFSAQEGDDGFASCCADTFVNHITDFIATNPPEYGVNWMCAMDVAIRAANWLLAFDLFRAAGYEFARGFTDLLLDSLYQHGLFIENNLEFKDGVVRKGCSNNHYYANLVGLVFLGAYLPVSEKSAFWLGVAASELPEETLRQFHPDGSNFEGSTSYHRLSGELLNYAALLLSTLDQKRMELACAVDIDALAALILPAHKTRPAIYEIPGMGTSLLPPEIFRRMYKAMFFSMRLTDPQGKVVQIGDNDSGRLFKLQPSLSGMNTGGYEPLTEEHLDHRAWVGAANGFFADPEAWVYSGNMQAEGRMIGQALKGRTFCLPPSKGGRHRQDYDERGYADITSTLPGKAQLRYLAYGKNLLNNLSAYAYDDFGLFIWRSEQLLLVVRCGERGQGGVGGHDHNDQLNVELWINGECLLRDPGTYLYTPLPEERNAFRSVRAHNSPRPIGDKEPGDISRGLFELSDKTGARTLFFSAAGFVGQHGGYGAPVWRCITIDDDRVEIIDGAAFTLKAPEIFERYSPGYGMVVAGNNQEKYFFEGIA